MREQDLRAKYLVLPPNIDIKDMVVAVDTKLTEVEHSGNRSTTGRARNSSARHRETDWRVEGVHW